MQNVRDMVDVKLKGDVAAQLAKHPIVYDTGFTLPPGAYNLKFLARDNESGKMGTYQTKFVIPDLTAEQKLLPISSVILSSQRVDPGSAVFSAERDKKLLAANPLVQDGQKLIPSVTRVFNKSQEMYVYLEAYQPGAQSTEPVFAKVAFYRGKTKAFETPPSVVTTGLNDSSKAVPLKFSVPLAKLPPGRYTCQVSVLAPDGAEIRLLARARGAAALALKLQRISCRLPDSTRWYVANGNEEFWKDLLRAGIGTRISVRASGL